MKSATKNPAAVALAKLRAQKLSPERQSEIGRVAGKVGGVARAKKLTPERRSEIARKAGKAGAAKRWGKRPDKGKGAPFTGTLDGVAPEPWDKI